MRAFRKAIGDPDRDRVAAKIRVGKSTLASYERGETEPTASALAAYRDEYGANILWIVSGEGEMFSDPARAPTSPLQIDAKTVQAMHSAIERIADALPLPDTASQPRNGIQSRPPKRMKYFSSVYASAGAGLAALHEAPGADLDAEGIAHELLGYDLDEIWLFPVKGDSMLPTFSHGDIVVVERWKGADPEEGRIYVVSIKGEILAKRAHWDDGRLILQSDNSAYADVVVPDSEPDNIKVLGEVVWRFQPIRRRKA